MIRLLRGFCAGSASTQSDPAAQIDVLGHGNSERAGGEPNYLARWTIVDRILNISEIISPTALRIDRRANCRPMRNATNRKQPGVLPIRIGVVIGRQHAACGVESPACAEPRKTKTQPALIRVKPS